MEVLSFSSDNMPSIFTCILVFFISSAVYHELIFVSRSREKLKLPTFPAQLASQSSSDSTSPESTTSTALQQHILFWDRDDDSIIYPHDVYTGFREISFSIPFSLTALLIPIFFSYPTTLAHSYFPDPLFRVYVSSIHKTKHGSDTGIYDLKGNYRPQFFDQIFVEFDSSGKGSLGAADLWRMWARNRVAADPAGWTFAAMEWSTTCLLLQREGRVHKDDLSRCYDGSLFRDLRNEVLEGRQERGYGVKEFYRDALAGFSMLRSGKVSS